MIGGVVAAITATTPPDPWSVPDLQSHTDGLDLGVCVQYRVAHFATPTGLLVAAERKRRIEDVVAVDPDRSGAQPRRDPMCLLRSLVQMPDASPYTVSLATGSRSLSRLNGIAVTTGPKISSRTTRMFGLVSTSTVGSRK